MVLAGKETDTRCPTLGSIVGLGIAEAIVGELVQIRSPDLPPIASEI